MRKVATFSLARVVLLALVVLTQRPAGMAWAAGPVVNLPICTADSAQSGPRIATDGSGGAIIAWNDNRGSGTNTAIYAQRVLASGVVAPGWPINGLGVSAATSTQLSLSGIVPDCSGGAIVIWKAVVCVSASCVDGGCFAQHVLASGALDPGWPAGGLQISAQGGGEAVVTSDGACGAIVAWEDYPGGVFGDADIYAQRVLASGSVAPGWPPNGRTLSVLAGQQRYPALAADGAGGALVAWYDMGGSGSTYAQHVLASGALDSSWPAGGRLVLNKGSFQTGITNDGAGGAIVALGDLAQHVLAAGALDAAWPPNGRHLCGGGTAPVAWSTYPSLILGDGSGGALVAWMDYRSGSPDIYAQHALANGSVDSAWPPNGRAMCTAVGQQRLGYQRGLIGDGAGGMILTWEDDRAALDFDIYAQHILASGVVDPSWPVDGRAVCTAQFAQRLGDMIGNGAGGAIATWDDNRLGTDGADAQHEDIYAQRVLANGQLADVPGGHSATSVGFALDPVRPNPVGVGGLNVSFVLPSAASAYLELLDVAGRRLESHPVSSMGAGRHTLTIAGAGHLAPGLYLVRLRQGAESRVARVAVLR